MAYCIRGGKADTWRPNFFLRGRSVWTAIGSGSLIFMSGVVGAFARLFRVCDSQHLELIGDLGIHAEGCQSTNPTSHTFSVV